MTQANEWQMAANGTWTADVYVQKFLLDRWGNRQLDATSTGAINKRQFAVNTATNRLSVPAGQNGQMSYDAAGFLTTDTWTDPASQAVSRVYDAPGRMTTAKNSASNDIARYTYDADGHRTRRSILTGNNTWTETWQVYGVSGELVAEYAANTSASSPQKEYGYRSGEMLIAAESSDVKWTITDHLGSLLPGKEVTLPACAETLGGCRAGKPGCGDIHLLLRY